MPAILLDTGVRRHPRTLALRAALGGDRWAWAYLANLWSWAMEADCEDGRLRVTGDMLEEAADWRGEPGAFVRAAETTGWILRLDASGAWWELHAYQERNRRYFAERERLRLKDEAKRLAGGASRGEPRGEPRGNPGGAPVDPLPSSSPPYPSSPPTGERETRARASEPPAGDSFPPTSGPGPSPGQPGAGPDNPGSAEGAPRPGGPGALHSTEVQHDDLAGAVARHEPESEGESGAWAYGAVQRGEGGGVGGAPGGDVPGGVGHGGERDPAMGPARGRPAGERRSAVVADGPSDAPLPRGEAQSAGGLPSEGVGAADASTGPVGGPMRARVRRARVDECSAAAGDALGGREGTAPANGVRRPAPPLGGEESQGAPPHGHVPAGTSPVADLPRAETVGPHPRDPLVVHCPRGCGQRHEFGAPCPEPEVPTVRPGNGRLDTAAGELRPVEIEACLCDRLEVTDLMPGWTLGTMEDLGVETLDAARLRRAVDQALADLGKLPPTPRGRRGILGTALGFIRQRLLLPREERRRGPRNIHTEEQVYGPPPLDLHPGSEL